MGLGFGATLGSILTMAVGSKEEVPLPFPGRHIPDLQVFVASAWASSGPCIKGFQPRKVKKTVPWANNRWGRWCLEQFRKQRHGQT